MSLKSFRRNIFIHFLLSIKAAVLLLLYAPANWNVVLSSGYVIVVCSFIVLVAGFFKYLKTVYFFALLIAIQSTYMGFAPEEFDTNHINIKAYGMMALLSLFVSLYTAGVHALMSIVVGAPVVRMRISEKLKEIFNT